MIRRFYKSALIISCMAWTSLSATSVTTVNLAEMVRNADRVFYGRCVSTRESVEPETGMAIVEYEFEVLEGLKGVRTGETIRIRQLDSEKAGLRLPGIPSYQTGQELLLFLHGDSRLGLTSPVGMAQGLFEKRVMASGEPGFVNSYQNSNLAHQLRSERAVSRSLSPAELSAVESGNPVPLSVLQRMIQKIELTYQESDSR